MRTVLRTLAVAVSLVLLTACGTIALPAWMTGATAIDTAGVLFSTYADFVIPGIHTYGTWPYCSPDAPLVKLCRKDKATWDAIKSANDAAVAGIVAYDTALQTGTADTLQVADAVAKVKASSSQFCRLANWNCPSTLSGGGP